MSKKGKAKECSKMKVKLHSCVQLFATPWTITYQTPLTMGFSKQRYWSGLPFPSPWDFPDPGIKPRSPTLQADTLPSEPSGKPKNVQTTVQLIALISHSSKVMLKIFHAMLQQYMNWEFPDVQAGFRKGWGTRDQIANIHKMMEKARKFQKIIYFCFTDYAKDFDCVGHNKLKNS